MVAAAAWGGAFLPVLAAREIKTVARFFVSFGAGILLGAALLHLLPEAFRHAGAAAGFWMLSGFLFLYLLETLSLAHACEEGECSVHHLGLLAALGLSLHNFANGMVLGFSGGLADVEGKVFWATLAHKAPEFTVLSVLLLGGEHSKKRIFLLLIGVPMTVPLGAMLGEWWLVDKSARWLGAALAFSAGIFLHLSVSDMAPQVHQARRFRWVHAGLFFLGIAAAAAVP